MNVSRGDGGRLKVLCRVSALLLGSLAPFAAAAQTDGPIRLTPPSANPFSPREVGPDRDMRPERLVPSAPRVERAPVPELRRGGDGVEVRRLEEPGARPVGLLDNGSGLGSDVWQGADPGEIQRLLHELPTSLPRSLSDLVQRLLLTRASVGEGASDATGAEFAGLRAEALVRLGNLDGGRNLAAAITERPRPPAAVRAEIAALLIENDRQAACEAATNAVESSVTPYAQRVLVFCQILAGRKDEASIGLDVIRETAGADDALFIAIAEKLLGVGVLPQVSPGSLSALHFAMWRTTNEPVPAESWRSSDPSIWQAMASSADAALPDRIEAAELAVASGALPAASLASLYQLLEGSPGERDRVASEDPPAWTVRERALLFQNAAAAVSQPERAAALQRLFELARARGGFEAVALAAIPLLTQLDPSARLTFFAPDAARAYLLAHDVTSAEEWAALAQRERGVNPYAARDAIELLPLLALAGGEERTLADDDFAEWWERRLEADAAGAAGKAALIVHLMEALGEPLPRSAAIPGIGGMSRPLGEPGAGLGLATSVGQQSRGTAILQVAHLLGREGPEADPYRIGEAVRALRLVGLESEARRLAIEAAIDAGL